MCLIVSIFLRKQYARCILYVFPQCLRGQRNLFQCWILKVDLVQMGGFEEEAYKDILLKEVSG